MSRSDGFDWYRHYPERFLTKTQALEDDEVGVYMRLINQMYLHGGSLPDGWNGAGKILYGDRANKNKAKVWKRIRQRLLDLNFISIDDRGRLVQRTVEEELAWQKSKQNAPAKKAAKTSQQTVSSPDQTVSSGPREGEQTICSSQQTVSSVQQRVCSTHKPLKTNDTAKGEREGTYVPRERDPPSLFADAKSEPPPGKIEERSAAVGAYNATAARCGWAKCAAELSADRRAKLDRHLRDRGGLPGWMRDLAAIQGLEWTHGGASRSQPHAKWKFSIDCMFASTWRNRMDDARAEASGGEHAAPGLTEADQRAACEFRRERGEWPAIANAGGITNAVVRAEFPDLFPAPMRQAS